MRIDHRAADQLRPVSIERAVNRYAEGSALIQIGRTRVLCTASILLDNVPRFKKGSHEGWLTAEYSMLPRATQDRNEREATKGKQTGRTIEIQRLIGRALRNCVDLKALGEHTVIIDCDVLEADGGTRTAAITGGAVALCDALTYLHTQGVTKKNPFTTLVTAVSVGIWKNQPILDLAYTEDSTAQMDMNIVLNALGEFIEIQGTAESKPLPPNELSPLLALAQQGALLLLQIQKQALGRTE
jgi:ribonuclease PH